MVSTCLGIKDGLVHETHEWVASNRVVAIVCTSGEWVEECRRCGHIRITNDEREKPPVVLKAQVAGEQRIELPPSQTPPTMLRIKAVTLIVE